MRGAKGAGVRVPERHPDRQAAGTAASRRDRSAGDGGRAPFPERSHLSEFDLAVERALGECSASGPSAPARGSTAPRAGAREVHGRPVWGLDVDAETRCRHWHGPSDIIALRMRCCGLWVPCSDCHDATSDHPIEVWGRDERDTPAVLCGGCGLVLSIASYLACEAQCPGCRRRFNPGCANHYDRYFAGDWPASSGRR